MHSIRRRAHGVARRQEPQSINIEDRPVLQRVALYVNPLRKIWTEPAVADNSYESENALEEGRAVRGGLQTRAFTDSELRPSREGPRMNGHAESRASSSIGDRDADEGGISASRRTTEEHGLSEKDFGEGGSPSVNGVNHSKSHEAINAEHADGKPRVRGKFRGLFRKKQEEHESRSEEGSEKKTQPNFTVGSQLRATLLNSWVNILLLAVPAGIALHPAGVDPIIVFVVNFVAIIPLAAMLSYATEEIALRTGETIGGLLNATFGNAVELIVSIIALIKGEVLVVKTSLIGSMLSNLLLVLGMCFFFGGLNRVEQNFNVVVAQTAASLLALAIGSLIIPTAFDQISTTDGTNGSSVSERNRNLAPLSRVSSIILLAVYGCYLFFQLKTHITIYNAPSEKVEKRSSGKKKEGDASRGIANIGGAFAASTHGAQIQPHTESDEDEEETPQLSLWVALFTLAASTVLVAICAEFMVDSIDAVSDHISKTFVGLILLPIVGNAAEHATAVTVAIKDKMDLAIGVAVGSSMQIALLVLPLAVIIGWIIGQDDMTLFFDTFQIAVLFISILLVNYLIADGKSHWLEGIQLMVLYALIALASGFYGDTGANNKK